MRNLILGFALLALSGTAAATGFTTGSTTWGGNSSGYTSSVSTGGSMAETGVAGNGYAASATQNASGGASYATSGFNGNEGYSQTNISSYSNGVSAGVQVGGGYSESAGGAGTDVNAGAWSNYQRSGNGWSGWAGFSW